MENIYEKIIKNIIRIRKITISLITTVICAWAFFKNNFFARIIISPFIICSSAIFIENISLLFNKEKIANIFKYIFRISFFAYIFGFLMYATYYVIINKTYDFIILIIIFLIFSIYFFKKAFFVKKDKEDEIEKK